MGLGDRGTDHTGFGEGSPGVAVDMIVGDRQILQATVGRQITEHLLRDVVDRLLFVVEREVHQRSAFG